jgi:serine/threonine protein kinase, bacterial
MGKFANLFALFVWFECSVRVGEGSPSVIAENELYDNTQSAVSLTGAGTTGIVRSNIIRCNKEAGIRVGEEAQATIVKNSVSENALSGIIIAANGIAELEGNDIRSNGQSGCLIAGGAHCAVTGNTIEKNTHEGVTVKEGAVAYAENNRINENSAGVWIADRSSSCQVLHCSLSANETVGIYVCNEARSLIDDTDIVLCPKGIAVAEQGQCRCQQSRISQSDWAVSVSNKAVVELADNQIADIANSGVIVVDASAVLERNDISSSKNALDVRALSNVEAIGNNLHDNQVCGIFVAQGAHFHSDKNHSSSNGSPDLFE